MAKLKKELKPQTKTCKDLEVLETIYNIRVTKNEGDKYVVDI